MKQGLRTARFDRVWTEAHPWAQDVLYHLGRFMESPALGWLNALSRRLSLVLVFGILGLRARRAPNPIRFEPRHSILYPGEFRLFQSDIDVAAIFQHAPTDEDLEWLASIWKPVSDFIPLLGELEIYTRAEWRVKNRIRKESALADCIQLLWDFRKMHWIEMSLHADMHRYHLQKKERALAKSWTKLGEQPSSFCRRGALGAGFHAKIQRLFSQLELPPFEVSGPVEFYCKHLQCEFSSLPQRALYLPSSLIGIFLALLPPAQELDTELKKQIDMYRTHPKVRRVRSLLLLDEYLTVKSRQRTHPAIALPNETWLAALRRELIREGTIFWEARAE